MDGSNDFYVKSNNMDQYKHRDTYTLFFFYCLTTFPHTSPLTDPEFIFVFLKLLGTHNIYYE